jgi:glycerophosphoryl diester phosphodiesterase
LLFAHRGVTDGCPENSRESIEQARRLGFKGLEIDIRKTSDNEFILFHDGNANRLLGQDTLISSMPLSQVRGYHLLMNKDTSKSKVITLKEMLDDYKEDFIFYFDMKLGNFNDIDDLVHLIWTYDISRSVIVASPSFLVILYIEYNYPAINTALEGFDAGTQWSWYVIPKKLKPDFLSGFASKIDEEQINWLKKNELLSTRIVYGVDSTNYQEMTDYGVKKMIIDYFPALQVP